MAAFHPPIFGWYLPGKQSKTQKCDFTDVGQEIAAYRIWTVIRKNKDLEVSMVAPG